MGTKDLFNSMEESLPEEEPASEILEDSNEPRDRLKARCVAAKILFEERESPDGSKYGVLHMPSGRDKRSISFWRVEQIESYLSVAFERFIFLSGYEAICSYQDRVIEAEIRPLGIIGPPSLIYDRLFGRRARDREIDPKELTINLRPSDVSSGEFVSIGPISKNAQILLEKGLYSFPSPTIKIYGVNVTRHDQAVEYLERIANSVFFEIDLTFNLSVALLRERRPPRRAGTLGRKREEISLQFPQYEYDPEPISLYWYARSAKGMPLLQFLAYYQSIEFYFPIYSQMDAQRRLRNILKDPTFNPNRDADVGRLLAVMKSTGTRGYGDERSQLRATIQECLSPDALRDFLMADKDRMDFFSPKHKAIGAHKIPIANPGADLRSDVADRIYEIRCKIVHTKGSVADGEVELLLPFSKEAESLIYDIELIQYLSQQVIIAGSSPLQRMG